MIIISYKDGQNWTDIDGHIRNWTSLSEMNKDSVVQASFLAPEIVTDTWNGKIIDVQHIRWEVWEVELFLKESELHEVLRLQNCSDIIIQDLTNGTIHTVDTTSSALMLISEPERITATTNYRIIIRYRTGKAIINKGSLVLNQTNTLITNFNNGTSIDTNTFYTDYETLANQDRTDSDNFTNESGVNILSKAISKNVTQVLFIMSISNANILKKEFERAQDITLNGQLVLENSEVEYTAIGEGLIKLVVSCLLESEVSYPLNV